MKKQLSFALLVSWLVVGCGESVHHKNNSVSESQKVIKAIDYLTANEVYNPESVIPPQCYTKTEGSNNPCYVCHQNYPRTDNRPNTMNDGDLQGDYQFSDEGMTNSWRNLFVDRTKVIEKISDIKINKWVNTDNYQPFIETLDKNHPQFDALKLDNLAKPDIAFDEQGLAKDGSFWVAYNYKPFPSTFWPTNGSTGDAMIRLDKPFREFAGKFNRDVYYANLSLVEMTLKRLDSITTPELSEVTVGEDLNGDGKITAKITRIVNRSHYVGDAKSFELNDMLYPKNTELLHSVRYLGVDKDDAIFNAPRMKELRYMKKHSLKSKSRLAVAYAKEFKEKEFEQLPQTLYLGDRGIDNGFSWTINGFIEDSDGALRPQAHQELAFCNGCHKTIGSTIDQTFSFPRKVEGAAGWGYIDISKIKDVPSKGAQQGEFLTYMARVGGGDEFRQNTEMKSRWFKSNGVIDEAKVRSVNSLYDLIMPSAERAKKLNKAYYTIVQEQSYIFGRDATISSATNVLDTVKTDMAPLSQDNQFKFDIRLDWQQSVSETEDSQGR